MEIKHSHLVITFATLLSIMHYLPLQASHSSRGAKIFTGLTLGGLFGGAIGSAAGHSGAAAAAGAALGAAAGGAIAADAAQVDYSYDDEHYQPHVQYVEEEEDDDEIEPTEKIRVTSHRQKNEQLIQAINELKEQVTSLANDNEKLKEQLSSLAQENKALKEKLAAKARKSDQKDAKKQKLQKAPSATVK